MPLKDKIKEAAYQRAYRLANQKRIAALKKANYLANHEEILEKHKIYRKANPKVMAKGMVAWRKRHPKKIAAHRTYWNAVLGNKIERSAVCSKCGDGGVIHAHHADYSKPLEVEFMCRLCHTKHHKEITNA